jgi:predicted anti-sigma-YlaC factor YlaD
MRPCDRVDSLLSAYLENETSHVETHFVKSHTAECVRCHRQLDEVRVLLARIADLPRVQTAGDFTEKVLARASGLAPVGIEAQSVVELPQRRAAWLLPLAAAAAVTIAVLGVMEVQRNTGPETETAVIEHETDSSPPERFAPVDEKEFATNVGTTEKQPPVEDTLGDEPGTGESLGMARDAYILETYELLEPTGGGEPILTRVGTEQNSKVMVSF